MEEYQIGDLYVCPSQHIVKVQDKPITLTLKEFELLRTLIQNKGRILNRDQLLNKVWGYEYFGETRTVDVHIRHLRQKLGALGQHIETVRGLGYMFNELERE